MKSILYWKIHDFFFPKQKWLTKAIGKSWKDKDAIIQDTLFACVVHFVEEEDGLEAIWNDELGPDELFSEEYINNLRRVRGELNYCYNYIKLGRPALDKIIQESDDFDYICKMIQKQEDDDRFVINVIIYNMDYMWT